MGYRNDEMGPLAYISVGWEAVPWKSPDAVTFMVMQAIIGSYKKNAGLVPGSISGNRTINSVANKMGVGCADEFEAFMHFYKDTGMFGFYLVCDEVAVEHAIGELMFGVNLLSFSVTDEEVERAKRELKATLVNGSGSSMDACAQVGKEVLAYGRGLPPAEMMLRIDAVDAEEVKRVAYKYCNDQEISVTGLGLFMVCLSSTLFARLLTCTVTKWMLLLLMPNSSGTEWLPLDSAIRRSAPYLGLS